MNITQAAAALKKLYGNKAAWRYNDKALKGEEREALEASIPALHLATAQAKDAMDMRHTELLRDPEYIRLRAAWKAAQDASGRALGLSHSRRVTVGYLGGTAGLQFFHVTAEGDNWQEAIDEAKAKKAKP